MIGDVPPEQILQVMLVEVSQRLRSDLILVAATIFGDGRLEPAKLDPGAHFRAANMQRVSERTQGEAVAANLTDTQLPSMERAAKSFWTSVQSFCDFLDRVLREQFPCLVQLFRLPATVIDFRLDSMLDNESPAFFVGAARLTLQAAHELREFDS